MSEIPGLNEWANASKKIHEQQKRIEELRRRISILQNRNIRLLEAQRTSDQRIEELEQTQQNPSGKLRALFGAFLAGLGVGLLAMFLRRDLGE